MAKYEIDNVELPVGDPASSAAFFREAFGWSVVDYGADYQAVQGGGPELGLATGHSSAPLAIIRTDDLEQAMLQVVGAGGVITLDPFDFPGGRRFHFREPGGNELAVWMPVEG
jgi:uncharacterized protein